MSGILIILSIFIFIEIIIIGLIFSKASINIQECEIYYSENKLEKNEISKLKIVINIYFFKILKILSIKLYKTHWEIFKIKIKYNSFKEKGNTFFDDIKIIIKNREYVNINFLKARINKLNLFLSIGTLSQNITIYLIPIVSTILSILFSKAILAYDSDKYNYKIVPKYTGNNNLTVNFKINLTMNTIRLIYFISNIRNILKLNRE